jgi:DNA gyrase subunit A
LSAAGKGKAIANLVALQPGESVRAWLAVRDLEEEGKYVFFATRNGLVKKTPLKDFSTCRSASMPSIENGRRTGRRQLHRWQPDRLSGDARRAGDSLRRRECTCESMGRAAHGVRGMDLAGATT